MSKNLIISAFCDIVGMRSGMNIKGNSSKKDIYYRNAVVSLFSFKKNNPDCDVALYTNVVPPKQYSDLLEKNNISIKIREFDSFNFGDDIAWGLAFYKLCALKHALEDEYDNFLIVDNDTYCQNSLDDMWLELDDNILLYDINHRLNIEDCDLFNKEVFEFTKKKIYPTNYGGEFIAGCKKNLNEFLENCLDIFNEMKTKSFRTNFGDEFIIRLAANNNKNMIKNASGYIYRFWTGPFYLVSTCYQSNAVSILHVPDEKKYGMLKLFKILSRSNKTPGDKRIWRILHISRMGLKQRAKRFLKSIIKK